MNKFFLLLLLFNINFNFIKPQIISPIFGKEYFKNNIITNIRLANNSIKATIYKLDDNDIIGEITNASKRGVIFDFICDEDAYKECINFEKYGRISKFTKKSYNKLHAKSILIDNKILILGSFNLDKSAFTTNMEVGIIIEDTNVVNNYNNFLQKVKE